MTPQDPLLDVAEEVSARSAGRIDAHIGARMKYRRMQMSISQEQLSERLNLSFQQIQKYEKGVNRISAARLLDIAACLDVPIYYFYDGLDPYREAEGASTTTADDLAFLVTREGHDLVRAFLLIANPTHRRAVIELAEALGAKPNQSPSSDP